MQEYGNSIESCIAILAACTVKRGDSIPLEHVGRYVQTATWAETAKIMPFRPRLLGAWGLATWGISAIPEQHATSYARVMDL